MTSFGSKLTQIRFHPGISTCFLRAASGRVAIRRQTYGGSIKHIEPHHLHGLLVPRLEPSLEMEIHNLAMEFSTKVSLHVDLMREATARLLAAVGITDPKPYEWRSEPLRVDRRLQLPEKVEP